MFYFDRLLPMPGAEVNGIPRDNYKRLSSADVINRDPDTFRTFILPRDIEPDAQSITALDTEIKTLEDILAKGGKELVAGRLALEAREIIAERINKKAAEESLGVYNILNNKGEAKITLRDGTVIEARIFAVKLNYLYGYPTWICYRDKSDGRFKELQYDSTSKKYKEAGPGYNDEYEVLEAVDRIAKLKFKDKWYDALTLGVNRPEKIVDRNTGEEILFGRFSAEFNLSERKAQRQKLLDEIKLSEKILTAQPTNTGGTQSSVSLSDRAAGVQYARWLSKSWGGYYDNKENFSNRDAMPLHVKVKMEGETAKDRFSNRRYFDVSNGGEREFGYGMKALEHDIAQLESALGKEEQIIDGRRTPAVQGNLDKMLEGKQKGMVIITDMDSELDEIKIGLDSVIEFLEGIKQDVRSGAVQEFKYNRFSYVFEYKKNGRRYKAVIDWGIAGTEDDIKKIKEERKKAGCYSDFLGLTGGGVFVSGITLKKEAGIEWHDIDISTGETQVVSETDKPGTVSGYYNRFIKLLESIADMVDSNPDEAIRSYKILYTGTPQAGLNPFIAELQKKLNNAKTPEEVKSLKAQLKTCIKTFIPDNFSGIYYDIKNKQRIMISFPQDNFERKDKTGTGYTVTGTFREIIAGYLIFDVKDTKKEQWVECYNILGQKIAIIKGTEVTIVRQFVKGTNIAKESIIIDTSRADANRNYVTITKTMACDENSMPALDEEGNFVYTSKVSYEFFPVEEHVDSESRQVKIIRFKG